MNFLRALEEPLKVVVSHGMQFLSGAKRACLSLARRTCNFAKMSGSVATGKAAGSINESPRIEKVLQVALWIA